MKARLLLADDHALVLDGFRRLLADSYDVVGLARDGQSLIRMAGDLAPDVIVVDVAMPQLNGLDAIERVLAHRPGQRIVVLTMQEDRDTAAEAIRRGALGYVLKAADPEELFEAIRQALRGKVYVSPALAGAPPGVFAGRATRRTRRAGLTLRQREVVQLLAEGKSMKEAAHVLHVTPRTIAYHKYTAMEQLGLRTSAELVQYAIAHRLVGGAVRPNGVQVEP